VEAVAGLDEAAVQAVVVRRLQRHTALLWQEGEMLHHRQSLQSNRVMLGLALYQQYVLCTLVQTMLVAVYLFILPCIAIEQPLPQLRCGGGFILLPLPPC
jgi:hypothetical protein